MQKISMKKVGITGGIGAGKSIASHFFEIIGVPTYEADKRAKWLMLHNEDLKNAILQQFGPKSYQEDGKINTRFLAETVFSDEKKLQILNSLVHPAVALDFENWVQQQKNTSYVLKEAALLVENNSYKQLDALIVVTAPETIRIKRILNRDKQRSSAEVKAILDKQLPEIEKIKVADFLIQNDDKQLVIPQILRIHQQLLNFS
jgi:dephospho-CoA kinase